MTARRPSRNPFAPKPCAICGTTSGSRDELNRCRPCAVAVMHAVAEEVAAAVRRNRNVSIAREISRQRLELERHRADLERLTERLRRIAEAADLPMLWEGDQG